MDEWIEIKVGDVLIAPERSKKVNKKKYKDKGLIPIIDQSEKFIAGFIDEEEYRNNDFPIIIFGDHTRRLKFIKFSFAIGADGTQLIKCNNELNILYFYYALNNLKLKNYGYERHFKYLKDEIIFKPNLTIQKKIATILSNYDELIENNNKRIEILEQQSKLIYDEWFVKFKFPNHEEVEFEESELGRKPKDWEIKKVGDILKRLKAGNKYTQDNVEEEGIIPVIDQSTKEILGFHNNEADHKATSNNPIMIFGDHTCKLQIEIKPFSVGPNVIPFKSLEYPEIFVYFLIKNQVKTKEYKRHWNELIIKKVIVPSVSISQEYVEKVVPLFETIENLKLKNQNLRKTRDLLLPKLMSGELSTESLNININEE